VTTKRGELLLGLDLLEYIFVSGKGVTQHVLFASSNLLRWSSVQTKFGHILVGYEYGHEKTMHEQSIVTQK